MNLSGEAIQLVQNFYKISSADTAVVYDELDLALGTIRTGEGGSSAGHNGIKSVSKHLENKYWRIRAGIGPKAPKEMDTADFVLQKFSQDQQAKLSDIKKEVVNLINDWLSGSQKADTRKV